MARMLLINDPNPGLPGIRESGVYGKSGPADSEDRLTTSVGESGHEPDSFHRDAEQTTVVRNPKPAAERADGNQSVKMKLSKVFVRKDVQHRRYFSNIAEGCIVGLGTFAL
jgi:3-dehydroquinate dehydratase-2